MQENLKSEYNAYVRAVFLTVIIEGIYISLTGVPKGLNAWVTVVFIGLYHLLDYIEVFAIIVY